MMERSFLLGLLLGVAAGAATGLLLAPKSGREIRMEVATRSKDAVDRISKTATSVTGKLEDIDFKLKPAM